MSDKATYTEFTLVFEGDIRNMPNPHATETPFGRPIMSGVFNAFDRMQDAESELEDALALLKYMVSQLEFSYAKAADIADAVGQFDMGAALRDTGAITPAKAFLLKHGAING